MESRDLHLTLFSDQQSGQESWNSQKIRHGEFPITSTFELCSWSRKSHHRQGKIFFYSDMTSMYRFLTYKCSFQIQKPNLILNVDGCIAVCFVDLMRQCGCFTKEESQEFIDIGALNAVFVLGRR